jgi:phospholipid-binding lipoprotein MlaA
LRYRQLLAVMVLCVAAAGCADTQEAREQNDPLEPMNRLFFGINHSLDNKVALPAATFYRSVTPEVFRTHLHNFLSNLHLPITFANDLLQGNFSRGGDAVGRFGVNTTLGFGGVFDVASDWGMPYHQEDFGQTMGWYGVPPGPYLVLPLAGPAYPRDIAGGFVDRYFDPLHYFAINHDHYWSWTRRILTFVDGRSRSIADLRLIERTSIDLYATTRSLYSQARETEIRNGEPDIQGLPDF